MSSFENQHPRQSRGTSTGGQFTAKARGEADVTLGGPVREAGMDEVLGLARDEGAMWASGDFDRRSRDLEACEAIPEADAAVVREEFFRPLAEAYWAAERGDTSAQARAEELADQLNEFVARERRWHADPTFRPPHGTAVDKPTGGPVVYTDVTGSRYTGFRDVVAVAKDVRRDLKDAQRAGFLPDGLTFSVRCDKFSGGQSMHVAIRGLNDEQVWAPDSRVDFRREYRESALLVRRRVQAIAENYNHTDTDIQTDYFDHMYYCFADLEAVPAAA